MSISGTASTVFQQGSRGATQAFNRFVEGDDRHQYSNPNAVQPDADKRDFWDDFSAAGEERVAAKQKKEPERKDFWDEFSDIGAQKSAQPAANKPKSSIGTAAMSKRKPAEKKEDEGWGDW
jgi:hypothetical protein